MGARAMKKLLASIAAFLFTTAALAQNFPYFPPPGTNYTSGTLTWTGIASGNFSSANTWTALQTFGTEISIGGVQPSGATGTGVLVFGTSPTLTTPNLGTPSAINLANATYPTTVTLDNLTVTGTCTGCGSGGSGINQLTQDVLAGPTTGAAVATVVGANGQTFPTNAPYTYTNISGQFFAGTPTGCISSGSPANQMYNLGAVNPQSGAYTIGTDPDDCALVTESTTATVSLPPASGSFGVNYTVSVQDIAASGTVTITPLQIGAPTQTAPSTATTGGSLAASTTYYFKVVAVDGAGSTTPSGEESIETGSSTATNTITLNFSAGTNGTYATSYQIWYGTSSGGENAYYSAASTATSYVFTAASGTSGTIPSSNTTASTINGAANLAFSTQWATATLWSDGANWHATGTAVVSSSGSTGGVVASFGGGSLAEATTEYYPGVSTNIVGAVGGLCPVTISLKGLTVATTDAPASGQTFIATVFVGTPGSISPGSPSSITCTITSAGKTCTDSTDTASCSAGQQWVIQLVTSATSGPTGTLWFGLGKQ
jgi:hypothetical protein